MENVADVSRDLLYRILIEEFRQICLRHIYDRRQKLTAYALRRLSMIASSLVTLSPEGSVLALPRVIQSDSGKTWRIEELPFLLPFTYRRSKFLSSVPVDQVPLNEV